MMIQKFIPDGPNKSSMNYEIYRHKDATDEKFHQIADTYARVMAEDKVLCDRAQKNLDAGIFTCGEMHPKMEKGPLFFQGQVRKVITEHFNREKASGREIWPARPPIPDTLNAGITRADMEICNGLACGVPSEGLVW